MARKLICSVAVMTMLLAMPLRSQAEWPLFRGDAQSTGVASGALAENLDLLWKYTVPEGAFEATAAIVDGTVYVADLDGEIYALDLTTGKERWKHETEAGFIASPVVREGLLYVGDYDGLFYCLDTNSGKLQWTHQTQAEIDSAANFYKNRVLVGSQDATLYCLDARKGDLIWKHQIDDQIRCTPTIAENRVFLAGCDGRLHIVEVDGGTVVGQVDIGGPTGVTPAVVGDRVFFGTEGGQFYCIDWKKAETVWTYTPKRSGQAYRSSAAVTAKQIVVGSRNRSVQSIDHNGQEQWTYPTKQRIDSSPVIVGERVYFGGSDGRVCALSAADGKKVWEYEAGGGFTASPAVGDGRLVIASDEGVVYCFGRRQ